MKTVLNSLLPAGLGLLLGLTLALGGGVGAERDSAATARIPYEELRNFTDVFARIKNDYVEPVEDKELLENAIRGMLTGLDPHSTYLNQDDFKELQIGTTGEFGGLGIEVGLEDGFVKVVAPIDDTPADRAGIKAGDLIVRLDETPVKGLGLDEAVKLMRGKPGTDIKLTVVREGEERPLEIVVTRAVIQVQSVKSRQLDPGYGYLRITQFQAKTADALREAVRELTAGGRLKGVVLDLRNNPGGVLDAAVEVSDAFLEQGLIVYTEGRTEDSSMRFDAQEGDILNGVPMVILVNQGSASASEIVAGALQDHRRAVVMGTKTFGKGSVQTILPLNQQAAVKLTTARYFTPSGRSIQAEGIVPDIELGEFKIARDESSSMSPLKEADLSRHLMNGDETKTGTGAADEPAPVPAKPDAPPRLEDASGVKPGSGPAAKGEDLATSDYPLYEALILLKGLVILRDQPIKAAARPAS